MDETTYRLPNDEYNALIERLWSPEITEHGYSRREYIALVLAEAGVMSEADLEAMEFIRTEVEAESADQLADNREAEAIAQRAQKKKVSAALAARDRMRAR